MDRYVMFCLFLIIFLFFTIDSHETFLQTWQTMLENLALLWIRVTILEFQIGAKNPGLYAIGFYLIIENVDF